ncbi:PREDICTED: uncharacterized protein LOC104823447 [Tarenaya hassleriana]|uniref:uncharacterized protein LOC104823447 n=1 Tax=Tarenaya hassleriana TaxID=28532 RepID=UPI00053C5990|nr:PREDICTED: uncharacterized protein LOC104823447 [Tarenaya hassleriana]
MLPLITGRRERRSMAGGSQRRKLLFSLFLALVFGIAVYFRLWTIDYTLSSHDTERLRKQFDLANREAMDESAEWRKMYDEEAEKASRCNNELEQIKESIGSGNISKSNQHFQTLQKENMALLEEVKTLKQELEASRLKCRPS